MKFSKSTFELPALAAATLIIMTLLVACRNAGPRQVQQAKPAGAQAADLADFAALAPMDIHVHVYEDDPSIAAMLKNLDLRMMNVCVLDDRDDRFKLLEPQIRDVLKVRKATDGRIAFCTTFSPYGFEQVGFRQEAIQQLTRDFANGAIAVKIYKVMGMEMKNKAGKWVMPDDPAFEPIYKYIAERNRTVLAHVAEPDSCWKPLDPSNPDYSYWKEHPQQFAYLHPEWPSKSIILAARDHLLAENPNLRVVGAHLGSMETDVDQMARRFDRYPNFAVDTSGRMEYLMLQPRDKVRAFLIKYQDRVIYGTDIVLLPEAEIAPAVPEWREQYLRDWKFLATDGWVGYGGKKYQGLKLPQPVVHKIFHDNAVRWFPGISPGT